MAAVEKGPALWYVSDYGARFQIDIPLDLPDATERDLAIMRALLDVASRHVNRAERLLIAAGGDHA